jgi:hypothetical protein
MIEAPQPQGEQGNPYLPAGPPDPLIFEDFEGIDTATLRPGVDDKKAAWLDGFMPLAKRNLRTMYGLGASVYTAAPGLTIAFFDFINIRETPFAILVLSDGSVAAVNITTGSSGIIASPGTIANPAITSVGIANYGNLYVLIVAKQTDGFFVWDGGTFFVPGAVFGAGTIPLGIGGTAIETYQGRVWIANGATITFSAPGSFIDYSSAHGGGNFTSSDSFLRVQFTQLKQANGFLYLVADSSVNYISGVQTSGAPPVTTFTNQNADPEVGSPWPASVDVFNRNILFANPFGAQISYGGAVTKISEALDGVYNTVPNFANLSPSAAKAIIFGKKCWILLLPIVDPVSGQQVNKLLLWNGKIWWAATQDVSLIYIQHLEINSVLTAYGTDGNVLYPMFSKPSIAVTKVAQTKLWDKPGGYQFTKFVTRLWGIVKYYSSLSQTVNVSIDNEVRSTQLAASVNISNVRWLTASGAVAIWRTALGAISTWHSSGGGYSVLEPTAVAQSGILTGFTVTTNAADMAIVSMMIHDEVGGYRG